MLSISHVADRQKRADIMVLKGILERGRTAQFFDSGETPSVEVIMVSRFSGRRLEKAAEIINEPGIWVIESSSKRTC